MPASGCMSELWCAMTIKSLLETKDLLLPVSSALSLRVSPAPSGCFWVRLDVCGVGGWTATPGTASPESERNGLWEKC